MEAGSAQRSASRQRGPSSRPTTPLRPSSRSSLRDGTGGAGHVNPVSGGRSAIEALEPAFAELADSMADLEANFMHLQLMHESLSRFSENFASFLYGLNMNAFCVDFPEAPVADSFQRAKQQELFNDAVSGSDMYRPDLDAETTFMTTDTSFVENPPTSSKASSRFMTPSRPSRSAGAPTRGGTSQRGLSSRGAERGARTSGLARPRGRGVR